MEAPKQSGSEIAPATGGDDAKPTISLDGHAGARPAVSDIRVCTACELPRPWAMFLAKTGEAVTVCQMCRRGADSQRTANPRKILPVVRAATENMSRFRKGDLRMLDTGSDDPVVLELRAQRPVTRGDCENGPRPCAFVSCKFHLYLDVHPRSGSIKYSRPDLEPEQFEASCVLDAADDGGMTLEEVGLILNLSRERVRQIEETAQEKLGGDPIIQQLGAELEKGLEHEFEESGSDGFMSREDMHKVNIAHTHSRFPGPPVRRITERIGEVVGPAPKIKVRRRGFDFRSYHEAKARATTKKEV